MPSPCRYIFHFFALKTKFGVGVCSLLQVVADLLCEALDGEQSLPFCFILLFIAAQSKDFKHEREDKTMDGALCENNRCTECVKAAGGLVCVCVPAFQSRKTVKEETEGKCFLSITLFF